MKKAKTKPAHKSKFKNHMRNPLYKESDIIPYPTRSCHALVLKLEDRLNYYVYHMLLLDTGEHMKSTSWVVDQLITSYEAPSVKKKEEEG